MQMAKSKKTSKHNTVLAPLSNVRTLANFVNNDTFMDFPEKGDWRKRFCATMLDWAERETSLDMVQFCQEYRYARQTVYDWINRYPDIKEMYNHCKLLVGCRRRVGALKKDFDRDTVFKDMHVYDPEWVEINKYHAELKQQYNNESSGSFMISIAPAPSTGMVPPLKKSGDKDEQ